MIYILMKRILAIPQTSPIMLTLVGTIFLMFGTCFGIALLGKFSFLNIASVFFFILALLIFIPALINYIVWKRKGLLQPFSNGTVVWQLDHIRETSQRYRPLLSVRETRTLFNSHQVVFTLPETGFRTITVACGTCQQEAQFVVRSSQQRKARRIRLALISGVMLLLTIALGIWISPLFQPATPPDWVVWLRLLFLLLLCVSFGVLWNALSYPSVSRLSLPRGHQTRAPEKAELERYVARLASVSGSRSQPQG